MTVEEMLEGASSYTSLIEVAEAPQTEEPAATWVPLTIITTALAEC